MGFSRPEGASETDLVSPFQDGDDHDIGNPHPPDEECHGAERDEEVFECGAGIGSGDDGIGRIGDGDVLGRGRIRGGREDRRELSPNEWCTSR